MFQERNVHTFVPANEHSLCGRFVPGNESAWERNVHYPLLIRAVGSIYTSFCLCLVVYIAEGMADVERQVINLLYSVSATEMYTGLSKQLAKIHNSSLNTTFIFDEHLTFSDQISSVSRSCYYDVCQLRCICPYFDTKTASTIATSTVHSKLDCCNSLSQSAQVSDYPAPTDQTLARAVAKAPK